MQQHSTERQRLTVDSKRHQQTSNVSQSVNVSSLETACLTTVNVKSGQCAQEHNDHLLRMLSKSVTFLDFFLL